LANTTGVVVALFYLLVTIRYTKEDVFDQLISILISGVSVFIIITVILTFFDWSFQTIDLVATLHANFWLMLLYASPLSTIGQVIKTKSSASLEFKLCLAFVLNGSLWFIYGLVIQNYGVFIPNGIGAVLSMIQLALCFIYPNNDEDELSSSYSSGHNPTSPPIGHNMVDMLPHKPSLSKNQTLTEDGQESPSADVV
jgi:solute carrier family 50 protein (sugar transporter)